MKLNHLICGLTLAVIAIAIPVASRADGTNAVASTKPTPYPLDHCVVSGEKFDSDMGKPIEFIYQTNGINQEIKFCCPMCKPQFLADPDKYMKVIKDAEAAKK